MKKICWDHISEERLGEKISRKMIWGENIMVTRVELGPGTVVPVHDHASEQITMIEQGSIVMSFPECEVPMEKGDMIVIPGSKPHGVQVGPEGCIAVDLFSPIRQDFIQGTTSYYGQQASQEQNSNNETQQVDSYAQIYGFIKSKGINITLDELREFPVNVVARYAYEKECLTMGELRKVLGIDKVQAKALLREWKHGDDHSEYSYRRKLERMIISPSDPVLGNT